MQLMRDGIELRCSDRDVYERLLELDGKRVVELGCGAAAHTRALAGTGRDREVLAFEVDTAQHALNLAAVPLANVSFHFGGAEAIDCESASVDVVMMFKSLHHVPLADLPQAMAEIHRVLKPAGHLYVCEPLFAGAFNDILQLFHNEQRVREAAFAALRTAVQDGLFESVTEEFYLATSSFRDFAEFEQRVIGVSHTAHHLSPATRAEVQRRFTVHCGPQGARFDNPMRADLLRKIPT